MSRTFRCTFSDEIAQEIEQYVYGKTGKSVSHWLTDAVLGTMSKNPLTAQQTARIVRKYGKAAIVAPEPLAVPLRGENP